VFLCERWWWRELGVGSHGEFKLHSDGSESVCSKSKSNLLRPQYARRMPAVCPPYGTKRVTNRDSPIQPVSCHKHYLYWQGSPNSNPACDLGWTEGMRPESIGYGPRVFFQQDPEVVLRLTPNCRLCPAPNPPPPAPIRISLVNCTRIKTR
jgi:hypothetical protein